MTTAHTQQHRASQEAIINNLVLADFERIAAAIDPDDDSTYLDYEGIDSDYEHTFALATRDIDSWED